VGGCSSDLWPCICIAGVIACGCMCTYFPRDVDTYIIFKDITIITITISTLVILVLSLLSPSPRPTTTAHI